MASEFQVGSNRRESILRLNQGLLARCGHVLGGMVNKENTWGIVRKVVWN